MSLRTTYRSRFAPSSNLCRALAAMATAGALATGLSMAGPARAATPPVTSALPPAPAGPAAVAYSAGRAYVSWSPGAGSPSVAYRVAAYLVGPNGTIAEGSQTAIGTDAVVSGLQVGSAYDFAVNAVNTAGSGPASTTNQIVAVGSLVPGAPGLVKLVAAAGDNEVALSWQPSAAEPAAEH